MKKRTRTLRGKKKAGGKLTARWSELPPEMLELIFEKLIDTMTPSPKDYDTRHHDRSEPPPTFMLTCRLVNSTWKASMDKVLERKSLENWTKWRPEVKLQPLTFPNVLIVPVNKFPLTMIRTPSLASIYTDFHIGCPFPTKSVALHFCEDRQLHSKYPLTGVTGFFRMTGNYLNSLEISNLIVPPDVFVSILSFSRNLKALFINDGIVSRGLTSRPVSLPKLPRLKKLTHLQLYGTMDDIEFGEPEGATVNWFLSAYASQLLSFDTNQFNVQGGKRRVTFQKLKMLKCVSESEGNSTLLETSAQNLLLSDLEHISLLNLRYSISFTGLLNSIRSFENTLISLYLNFNGDRKKNAEDLKSTDKPDATLPRLLFPNMKKFGIFYPHDSELWRIVEHFLRMFPNLRKLSLFDYQYGTEDEVKVLKPEDETTVATFVGKSKPQFLLMCPKLEQISVYFDSKSVEPMYTLRL